MTFPFPHSGGGSGSGGGGIPTVTWNPSDKSSDATLSNGNLTVTRTSTAAEGGNQAGVRATYGYDAATANVYFEVKKDDGAGFIVCGVGNLSATIHQYVGNDANAWGCYQNDGRKVTNASFTSYGVSWTTPNNILGVVLKNGKLYFAKDNVWMNSGDIAAETGFAFSGLTGTLYPMISVASASFPVDTFTARFKSSDFTYSPPSGTSAWGT